MRAFRVVWILLAAVPLVAQSRKDPLTEQQVEEVREAGLDPLGRIKLFVGYVDQRSQEIHAAQKNKNLRIHDLYDEFTRLSDELQDNMDNYDQQHADLRKELKIIVDKTTEWTTVLNEPPASSQYDFVRKTALDANQSAHDTAVTMLADEEKYFAEKKKQEKEQEKKQENDEHSR